ncbi:hypothetical protein CRM90_28415 [Mycobacterium sp. ENV421]|uniref:hypothetical protein n=1 Tax=Mycobacterium sp. ENV421 TaxID=1213407 RepID=UPI000CBA1847|nr:hypothetical protein [Mycobacterium sp. ENV421]PND54339.1 hypothetical protein CRM90_28415 [Mycobacterium sp. ENV421]
MNTTPLWVPLVVAGLGLVGTAVAGLGGVWFTQRRADKREAATWARETEREQARWVREDAARTFEFRRSAYVELYRAAFTVFMLAMTYMGAAAQLGEDSDDPEVVNRYAEMQRALEAIQIYGSFRVLALAERTQSAGSSYRLIFSRMGVVNVGDTLTTAGQKWGDVLSELHFAIREELGIPDDDSPEAETWRSRWAWLQYRRTSSGSQRETGNPPQRLD